MGEGDGEEKRKKGERYTTSVTTGGRALLLTTNNNREVREEDWKTRTIIKCQKVSKPLDNWERRKRLGSAQKPWWMNWL
jgi:hypothetical protein